MIRVFIDMRVGEGGVGRYARDLVETLSANDDVGIVTWPGDLRAETPAYAAPFTPWGRWLTARAASRAAPHLIHCIHLETLPARAPQVVTIHDAIPLEHPASMPNPARRAVFRRTLARSFRRADAIIVPSARTASSLVTLGAPEHRITVVPHGVSARFHPASEEERARARARFAGGAPYVATILSAKAHKNSGVLTAVARALHPDVALVGVGGPAPAPVRAAGALPDEELVAFLGGAEVYVCPSVLEGFGLPALEALACGVPVICGTGLGALDLLTPGAVVVDVLDAHAITQAIESLIGDDDRLAGLRRAGLEVAQRQTLERMATATLDVFRGVLR